jgi:hypothetical protein
MSGDSQPVTILAGENRVAVSTGRRTRNPIVMRVGGGLVGLVGFAGTEHIEGVATADWLERFSATWPTDDVGTFCKRLAETLTDVWRRDGLQSILEILVTGEVSGDVQFWYVRNSEGLRDSDLKHEAPADTFVTKNELDDPDQGYVQRDRLDGETKDELLQRVTYFIRQGVLIPGAPVFNAFQDLLHTMQGGKVEGFASIASLDDLGHFARVRMEFLKRLCTARYGIYAEKTPTPIGGQVHVYGVARDGRVCRYGGKGRKDVKTLRRGRTPVDVRPPTDEAEAEYHRVLNKAAALDSLGPRAGTGAAIWARVVENELAQHESARDRWASKRDDEAWERLHGTALGGSRFPVCREPLPTAYSSKCATRSRRASASGPTASNRARAFLKLRIASQASNAAFKRQHLVNCHDESGGVARPCEGPSARGPQRLRAT